MHLASLLDFGNKYLTLESMAGPVVTTLLHVLVTTVTCTGDSNPVEDATNNAVVVVEFNVGVIASMLSGGMLIFLAMK